MNTLTLKLSVQLPFNRVVLSAIVSAGHTAHSKFPQQPSKLLIWKNSESFVASFLALLKGLL